MSSKRSTFPWKEFLRSVAVIAIPIALQNLLTTTGSMVDTMMIAPLGELSVGAVGLCAQFSSLMFSGYWGFMGGGMLFFAQYYGAKDDGGVNRAYGMTLLCMMADAVVFSGTAQSGVLSFLLPGEDCEDTARRLAEQGIAVRAGLHCAPLAHESAGTFESGTVRVSFSVLNTMTEVETFVGTEFEARWHLHIGCV